MQLGIPPGEDAGGALPVGWPGLTVLVVEDHPAYRILVGWVLQNLGLGFEVVDNGQAALDAMERTHFDLILTDCQMPVLDGYAMTRQVRQREQRARSGHVPIIAFTSTLGQEHIERCLDAGMDAWLVKPLSFEQLRDVLLQWLPSAGGQSPQSPLPTRASLVETFGSSATVEHLLVILMDEARQDLKALATARREQDAAAICRHLHRLIGGFAFLGASPLEARGIDLINAVADEGVAANERLLKQLQKDIRRYLKHLSTL